MLSQIWLALGFLTTLPVPSVEYESHRFSRAGRFFPWAGLLIGLLLAAAYLLLSGLLPPAVTAVLVVLLWAFLTGGLHLDGLADCCDGLLASASPQRRLEIMRDPRVGAYAAVGVSLFVLLKVTAVAASSAAVPAILLATTWSRWFLLVAARRPPARLEGMGAGFGAGITVPIVATASIAPLITLAAVLYAGREWRGVIGVLFALLLTTLILRAAGERLGGVTGDVFGLTVEVAEAAILLVYTAQI